MANSTLVGLEVVQSTPVTIRLLTKETSLGDGYEQTTSIGKVSKLVDYGITTGYLPLADSNALLGQLLTWKGVAAFLWSPKLGVAPKLFVCSSWKLVLVNSHTRQLMATFQEVIK